MKFIATDVDDSAEKMASRVSAQLTRPGWAMDSYFYRSHYVYEKELDDIIFRSWLYAGHVSEVPNVGDYLLFEIGEDSVIIVRDDDTEVQALINVCRHRGARVCEQPTGNRKTFVCPYHGWVYNTDGSLKAAREMHMREGFDPTSHGLKKARIAIYMGLIFINCDPDAADFLAPLANLDQPLGAYKLADAKIAYKQTYQVDANWKLALENYLECYHCATAHRAYARMHSYKDLKATSAPLVQSMLERTEEITGVTGMGTAHNKTYSEAEGFGACVYTSRYALFDGFKTGSEDGEPVAPLMGDIKDYDGGVGDFQMGPLTFMLNYPDHCVLYRYVPRGLTATDMEVVWFVKGDAREGVDYDREKLTWLWHNTTLEDEFIITRNSEGVNSRFFEPGPYHPEYEESLMVFVNWYLETLTEVEV